MRQVQEIKVREVFPATEQDWIELHKRMAKAHLEAISSCIDKLTCPKEQKIALLDAVIETMKNKEEV